MQYRKFGNTGIELSLLGFGAMRLPMNQPDEQGTHISMDASVDVLCYGFEQGLCRGCPLYFCISFCALSVHFIFVFCTYIHQFYSFIASYFKILRLNFLK